MSSLKSKFHSKCHSIDSIDSKRNNKLNKGKPSWQSRIIHFLFHKDDLAESQVNNPSNAATQSPTKKTDSVNNNIHIKKTTKGNNIDTNTQAKPKDFILNIAELRNCEIVSPFGESSDCDIAENEQPIWKIWGQYQDTSSLSLCSYLLEDNSDLKGEPNFVLINEYGYYSTSYFSDDEESEQRTFDGEFEIL